jgi:tryptophan synthase beta subunit
MTTSKYNENKFYIKVNVVGCVGGGENHELGIFHDGISLDSNNG